MWDPAWWEHQEQGRWKPEEEEEAEGVQEGRGVGAEGGDERGHQGSGEETPAERRLRFAARQGKVEEVKRLLEHGVGVTARSPLTGRTALLEAAWEGQVETVKLVLDHYYHLLGQQQQQQQQQQQAAKERQEGEKGAGQHTSLLEVSDDEGMTPLLAACLGGGARDTGPVVKLLLDRGASVEACRAWDGASPLLLAAAQGHTESVEALLAADPETRMVEVWDYWGRRPLWVACANGHVQVACLLLFTGRNGADYSARGGEAAADGGGGGGLTPLEVAEKNGMTACARLLQGIEREPERAYLFFKCRRVMMAEHRRQGHSAVGGAAVAQEAAADPSSSALPLLLHHGPTEEEERGAVLSWVGSYMAEDLFAQLLQGIRPPWWWWWGQQHLLGGEEEI